MKKPMKIGALALVLTVVASIPTIDANAYECNYISGAPSSVDILTFSTTGRSSGASKITIHSTRFSTYIQGAYLHVSCISHNASPQNINAAKDYYLKYIGSRPLTNAEVSVKGELKEYGASLSVQAEGTVKF